MLRRRWIVRFFAVGAVGRAATGGASDENATTGRRGVFRLKAGKRSCASSNRVFGDERSTLCRVGRPEAFEEAYFEELQ